VVACPDVVITADLQAFDTTRLSNECTSIATTTAILQPR
jgi:hypothetical protein